MKTNDTTPMLSISIVSRMTKAPIRMIREYEKYGLIKPRRIKGRRLFSVCEVGFIQDIRFYLTAKKMHINGLIEFHLRASCWEIKRCRKYKCPAYGNVKFQCWEVTKPHKQCTPEMCPLCPIFIIKKSSRKKKHSNPLSPFTYHKK
ncbi:MAG: MerR family DNA-binding transcriptional regulator [Planctomycetes bacterium]|nr:MerR family DNA-binding transcriptional regulator [Planctomycetota bacterium]